MWVSVKEVFTFILKKFILSLELYNKDPIQHIFDVLDVVESPTTSNRNLKYYLCTQKRENNKKRLKIQNTDLLIMKLNKNNVMDLVCFFFWLFIGLALTSKKMITINIPTILEKILINSACNGNIFWGSNVWWNFVLNFLKIRCRSDCGLSRTYFDPRSKIIIEQRSFLIQILLENNENKKKTMTVKNWKN